MLASLRARDATELAFGTDEETEGSSDPIPSGSVQGRDLLNAARDGYVYRTQGEGRVTLVKRELRERSDAAVLAGMKRERMVIDPGFGFGKNHEENYPLLRRFEEFHQLRFPLLVGMSRKSFIGRALARDGKDAPLTDRLYGTLAAETVAILKGAHIIRTHDVRACADAVRIADLAGS